MQVWHMSGAGNDFMVLDGRDRSFDYPALAQKLCAMTGADGFMAVDYAQDGDFTLHFYNSDGSRGEMCGNGSRCVCRFAYDNGIAGKDMTVCTDAGKVLGHYVAEDRYRVRLNSPSVVDLHRREDSAYVELGDPGVPHGVVALPDLDFAGKDQLHERAKSLRWDKAFPKGANINFYRWLEEAKVRVLTFERGVEDYTMACGTGCGSVAVTLFAKGELPGGKLCCQCQGGDLEVTLRTEGEQIRDVFLEGPATVLKKYELDI